MIFCLVLSAYEWHRTHSKYRLVGASISLTLLRRIFFHPLLVLHENLEGLLSLLRRQPTPDERWW
jgi:hypothetical protein